jgi:AraC family transcriptional regulator
MTGLNIELTPEWMSAHEIQDAHLGRERLVQSPASCCAAVSLLDALYGSATVDRDNALLDLAAGVTSDATERYEPVWLNAAKHYADEVGSDTSIRQIAREIGVHPVHLSRVFRAVTGTTFCAYLQKGRLRYATSLLFKGLSAGEAAIEAGFGDQFYMSRCFRRQFGMSPRRVTELRKMLSA